MTDKAITVPDDVGEDLVAIASAETIDSTLLQQIGFDPGAALSYARESGHIPTIEDVDAIVGAWGKDLALTELRELASHRARAEKTSVDSRSTSGGGKTFALAASIAAVAAALVAAGVLRWRRISTRIPQSAAKKRPRHETDVAREAAIPGEQDAMTVQDESSAAKGESASEA